MSPRRLGLRRPSAPLVVALLALFSSLGGVGYAASGGNFILGRSNSATSTTFLSVGLSGKGALSLTNTQAGPAAGFHVPSGSAPFTVSSSTRVANLNASDSAHADVADSANGLACAGCVGSADIASTVGIPLHLDVGLGGSDFQTIDGFQVQMQCSSTGKLSSTVFNQSTTQNGRFSASWVGSGGAFWYSNQVPQAGGQQTWLANASGSATGSLVWQVPTLDASSTIVVSGSWEYFTDSSHCELFGNLTSYS